MRLLSDDACGFVCLCMYVSRGVEDRRLVGQHRMKAYPRLSVDHCENAPLRVITYEEGVEVMCYL